MRTNNAMQLKARINNRAKEAGIALDEACETAKGIMRAIGWSEGAMPCTSRNARAKDVGLS